MSLFDENFVWARRVARAYCSKHGIDWHLKDECVQSAVIALWRYADRYDVRLGEFRPFIYRYLVGAILDCQRREWNRFNTSRHGTGTKFVYIEEHEMTLRSPYAGFHKVDMIDLVAFLDTFLTDRERAIVHARASGEPAVEIRKRLGLSERYEWLIYKRALGKLKPVAEAQLRGAACA